MNLYFTYFTLKTIYFPSQPKSIVNTKTLIEIEMLILFQELLFFSFSVKLDQNKIDFIEIYTFNFKNIFVNLSLT